MVTVSHVRAGISRARTILGGRVGQGGELKVLNT